MIIFTVNKQELLDALTYLKPFQSKEDTRYYINGIYIKYNRDTGSLTLVATDGHKLAEIYLTISDVDDTDAGCESVIMPRNFVDIAIAALKKDKDIEFATIAFNAQNVKICTINDFEITGKCIQHEYPDYKKVIPELTDESVTVGMNAAQFAAAAGVLKKDEFMDWTFNGSNQPVIIKPQNIDATVILMPHRTIGGDK